MSPAVLGFWSVPRESPASAVYSRSLIPSWLSRTAKRGSTNASCSSAARDCVSPTIQSRARGCRRSWAAVKSPCGRGFRNWWSLRKPPQSIERYREQCARANQDSVNGGGFAGMRIKLSRCLRTKGGTSPLAMPVYNHRLLKEIPAHASRLTSLLLGNSPKHLRLN